MSELVSVIIPIYNVSQYMDACIQSACDQDYKNIEIILVDDGATDDSGAKCDLWEKRDSRIRVIHKKNGGLSSARNAGLDAAKGKYIWFFDGDDLSENSLISTAVQSMEESVDLVVFRYYELYEDGHTVPKTYQVSGKFELNSAEERAEFMIYYILGNRLGWEAWNKLYRRDRIEQIGLRFADNNIIFAEDLYFCLCYCAHTSNIISITDNLYLYRQRETSIMSMQKAKVNVGRMNELSKAVLQHLEGFDECKPIIGKFPIMHAMILDNAISRYLSQSQISMPAFRKLVYEDVEDVQYMRCWLRRFFPISFQLLRVYDDPGIKIWKLSNLAYIYFNGSYSAYRWIYRIANRARRQIKRDDDRKSF